MVRSVSHSAPGRQPSMTGTDRGSMVEVRELEKWYRASRSKEWFCALSGIDLSVSAGEFIAIIGASGCGKTTLLRIIAGLLPYDRGEVRIDGEPVRGVPKNVGFVFQDPALLMWESVSRNVELGLTPVPGMRRQEREARVNEQLELMGLTDFREYAPYQISGGMQQRVGLARALIGQPNILFMDEPLGALDAFTRVRLQEELSKILKNSSCTSILVTHDVEEALYLAERIVVMSSGPGSVRSAEAVPKKPDMTRSEFLADPEIVQLRRRILSMIVGEEDSGRAAGADAS